MQCDGLTGRQPTRCMQAPQHHTFLLESVARQAAREMEGEKFYAGADRALGGAHRIVRAYGAEDW